MTARHWRALLSRRYDSPDQALPTTWVSQRLGSVLAAGAFWLGLGPNAVTLLGLSVMLLGCVAYAADAPGGWMAAALLWQLGFALDCADGQLARALARGSAFGAWLDVACDHVRQTAITLTLVYVLVAGGLPLWAALGAGLLLHAGFSVYLHTASSMKAGVAPALQVRGWKQTLRATLTNLLDTPLYLLLLCLLRPEVGLLALYVSAYGSLLLLRAVGIAAARLRP